jgi:hypothetical protein
MATKKKTAATPEVKTAWKFDVYEFALEAMEVTLRGDRWFAVKYPKNTGWQIVDEGNRFQHDHGSEIWFDEVEAQRSLVEHLEEAQSEAQDRVDEAQSDLEGAENDLEETETARDEARDRLEELEAE